MALMVSVYLIVDFLISGTFDYRVFIMFVLMVIVVIWGIVDWRSNYVLIRQKENELRLYQNYLIPLEELVKEIRAKQHEFDNHLNAILNMHLTIDNYEELVAKQSEYIKSWQDLSTVKLSVRRNMSGPISACGTKKSFPAFPNTT